MLLLTGATGYIGGRLLRRLERDAVPVRCICRNPEALGGSTARTTELVQGDLLQPASLAAAFEGVTTAYYLVHSMNAGDGFGEREEESARNFAKAAGAAGVERIIYLGGLAHGDDLSPHMRSRAITGDLLRESGVPVIEFQASIVIGSGSASYAVISALVDLLPVMITPRWVNTPAQPIAIEDVIEYLLAAQHLRLDGNQTIEIGGADVSSYAGIMREYARRKGLRRWIVRVPFLSLSLSSRWLTLITPVYATIGRSLIESVRNPSVVENQKAKEMFLIRPMGIADAMERAINNEDRDQAETRWCDAQTHFPSLKPIGYLLTNEQVAHLPVSNFQAFAPIRRIGGRNGWYFADILWRVRGLIDLMLGGVGMRRGRPDPETPRAGSTLDFWRVEVYEPNRRLRLFAEMLVPGRAWLEFRAEVQDHVTVLRQIAQFEPSGRFGLLYWYLLYPIHEVMFRGMLRSIVRRALMEPV